MLTTTTPTKKYLNTRAVGRRYGGRDPKTIKRWVKKHVLPPPDQNICGHDYWDEDNLDRHDRERTIEAGAKASSPTP